MSSCHTRKENSLFGTPLKLLRCAYKSTKSFFLNPKTIDNFNYKPTRNVSDGLRIVSEGLRNVPDGLGNMSDDLVTMSDSQSETR